MEHSSFRRSVNADMTFVMVSGPDRGPSRTAVFKAVLPLSCSCRVIHGPNESYFQIDGKSVAFVRRALGTSFNLPDDATAIVDGVEVDDDHRLRAGDDLTFIQQWGWKGGLQSDSPFHLGDPCPFLLTEAEAIRYLRLDTIDITNPDETLRRYRNLGLLRGTQVSKRVFYLRAELDELLIRLTNQNPR